MNEQVDNLQTPVKDPNVPVAGTDTQPGPSLATLLDFSPHTSDLLKADSTCEKFDDLTSDLPSTKNADQSSSSIVMEELEESEESESLAPENISTTSPISTVDNGAETDRSLKNLGPTPANASPVLTPTGSSCKERRHAEDYDIHPDNKPTFLLGSRSKAADVTVDSTEKMRQLLGGERMNASRFANNGDFAPRRVLPRQTRSNNNFRALLLATAGAALTISSALVYANNPYVGFLIALHAPQMVLAVTAVVGALMIAYALYLSIQLLRTTPRDEVNHGCTSSARIYTSNQESDEESDEGLIKTVFFNQR